MLDQLQPSDLKLLKQIGVLAAEERLKVYLVGGYVRDLCLGHVSPDMDFTVEGDGIAFAQKVASYFHTTCKAFTRFGTAIIQIPGHRKIDFVSARAESYPYSGSLPEVEFADIGSDLTRRDFTINAIALSLQEDDFGYLYALDNSISDLEKGIIRVIHSGSFKDDPTRILRAIRFEKRFNYVIEPATLDLMKDSIKDDDLHKISVERTRNEFELAFKEPNPELFFQRAEQLGIMDAIFPGFCIPKNLREKIAQYTDTYFKHSSDMQLPPLYQIYYLPLFSCLSFPDNLVCSKYLKLKWLNVTFRELHHFELHIRAKIEKSKRLGIAWKSLKGIHDLTIFVILCEEQDSRIGQIIREILTAEKYSQPILKGIDLLKMGIPEGTAMGHILDRLHMEKMDGQLPALEDELKFVNLLWQKHLEHDGKRVSTHSK
jgi:tRNA nucleotidyltransferase (CCA-adding enzyme)